LSKALLESKNKKAVLSRGNRAMLQLFFPTTFITSLRVTKLRKPVSVEFERFVGLAADVTVAEFRVVVWRYLTNDLR